MTADVELPRSYSGLSDAAKPKDPAYGVYFYNLLNRRIERWNGQTWEVVAQPVVGMAPYGTAEQLGTPRLNDAIAYALRGGPGGAGSIGGGGVSPAPGNTASPTEVMPGGTPTPGATEASGYAVGPTTVGAGLTVTYATEIRAVPPVVNNGGRAFFEAAVAFVAPIGVGDATLRILRDGVTIGTTNNAIGTTVLLAFGLNTMVPGSSPIIGFQVRNNSGIAFDIRDMFSRLTYYEVFYS